MDFKKIEKKWQSRWEKKKAFLVKEGKKEKHYVLEMYPYPSASGLHMGHAFNYTVGDIYARFKRMNGFNVLYPMGYDSFGLPAENAAAKAKSHPKKFTEDAIARFIKQQKSLGLSYDWSRMVKTSDSDYYKWDQWIFLQMYKKGLAYRKDAPVNWCPKCKTVLANEQVHSGKCWRHENIDVYIKKLEQWFFKITNYADELYEYLDKLVDWPEDVKVMQKNWINKKEWIDIDYEIDGTKENVTVSTTRPDTNFGATFVVMAPEHPLLSKKKDLVPKKYRKAVDDYAELAKKKTEEERVEEGRKKTGVFTGLYCINQLTKKKMPIWVTDFVMMSVGTGAVVGVPGHDKRDFEFAKEFDLPIVRVVVGSDGDTSEIIEKKQVQEKEGKVINSGFLDGLDIHKATKKIMDYIERKGMGRRTFRYKLQDWLVSRQRFWGAPIPIVYCDSCGVVPVKEKDLPVKLPENIRFTSAENPLVGYKKFVETKCPKCMGKARRETDTMDTFVNSSWYFLRYCDPKNKKQIFDKKKVAYWTPVDTYIGGKEHACMHLIYFRFYTKFLRDLGLLKFDEPAVRLFNQGMLHGSDGAVMSKSRGNVVLPEEVSEKYGIDTARLFLVSVASPDKDTVWSKEGVEGSLRFIKKVLDYFLNVKFGKTSARLEHKINSTIKLVSSDIENFRYNLAVIKIRKLFDALELKISKKDLGSFSKLLSPFCPHIAEELWERIGNKKLISLESWPRVDEKKINPEFEKADQAMEGLVSDILNILKLVKKESKKVYIYALPKEIGSYDREELSSRVGKEVIIFVVNDKKSYDPEGKSKKAKPGKPAIFLE